MIQSELDRRVPNTGLDSSSSNPLIRLIKLIRTATHKQPYAHPIPVLSFSPSLRLFGSTVELKHLILEMRAPVLYVLCNPFHPICFPLGACMCSRNPPAKTYGPSQPGGLLRVVSLYCWAFEVVCSRGALSIVCDDSHKKLY